MDKLAINGGTPVRNHPFPPYLTIGEEEKRAVMEVMDSGVLSLFQGTYGPNFLGGPKVQELERAWSAYLGVRHAVAVNSATSGLNVAIGALGISPGDEVIVTPYTMSASATCALIYHAIPVFTDIDPDTFCIDPEAIRKAITPRTRAIVVVHLFGHAADMDRILRIADEHNLKVVEDAAQAPGGKYKGRLVGTLGHIGVFSLNYHKHIQTGEGGIIVTNDDDLALRLQLIRNHAEVVVGCMGIHDIANMVGWNYRMTELEAAIGIEQLKKLDDLVARRVALAEYLTSRLSGIPGITPPEVRLGVYHVYYLYSMKYDAALVGVPRQRFIEAVRAEGVSLVGGYVKPLYLEPLYQRKIAFGQLGCPFTCEHAQDSNVDYSKGICPVTERLYEEELMFTNACHAGMSRDDIDDVADAFIKVIENRHELVQH